MRSKGPIITKTEMKAKAKDNTKPKKIKEVKKEIPQTPEEKPEEEETKEGGTLSDGVLDAFEETAPADPLLADDENPVVDEDDEEDLDYNPAEW